MKPLSLLPAAGIDIETPQLSSTRPEVLDTDVPDGPARCERPWGHYET